MTDQEISWLGEVAVKAANRAIDKGEKDGNDQNRAQFVEQVKGALTAIPADLRGDETIAFLAKYRDGAYGASATA